MSLPTPDTSSLDALLRDGVLDAELAALVWLTLEGGIPIVVTGEPGVGRKTLRDALLGLLPPGVRTMRLSGAGETFTWMTEAVELGWRHDGAVGAGRGRRADARPVR